MGLNHAFSPSASPALEDASETPWPSRRSAWFALTLMVLATAINFLGITVFGVVTERIKIDLQLNDEQLGWLIGPANILIYVLVGIPLARLVDIYPRRTVLALGLLFTSVSTALGGVVQGFAALFATRTLVGVGSAIHAPGSYSLMADFFAPSQRPRAIAFFQLGFIGGTTLGVLIGGHLLGLALGWGTTRIWGLTIYPWQWVLMMVALPGLLVAAGLMAIREPVRRGMAAQTPAPSMRDVMREIWLRRRVYLPLFLGVVFCAIEALSLHNWRTPFMIRTYGWTEAQIGNFVAPLLFLSSITGVVIGTVVTEWLSKRYKDAHMRSLGIFFALAAPCAIFYPMVPNGELSLILMALSGTFSLAAAVPQNAAIQLVTPNNMRGQVTAIYVFIFTLAGAFGTLAIAVITRHVVGDEALLWKALAITACLLVPVAIVSVGNGIRPYGREVERLEAMNGG